ncbi:MAG TPA: YdcF family protein [Paraburkholderia sp.]
MRRTRTAVAIAAVALFWLLATGWLAAPLLAGTQPEQAAPGAEVAPITFAAHTAIILLGGGTEYDDQDNLIPKRDALARIAKSADVYAQCKRTGAACEVIVSGGNPQRHRATEADTYLPWLLREHVPRPDIIVENRSLTTYENARNIAAILPHGHYGSLILITSAYHMPRALLDFQRFGITPQAVISNTRHARRGWWPRYENLVGAELALHELIGIAQFHVYRALGWF